MKVVVAIDSFKESMTSLEAGYSVKEGIESVDKNLRNPLNTTTYGVGEMIKDAIYREYRNFIIGIGGSATNDGGIGMLMSLGYDFLDKNGNTVPFIAFSGVVTDDVKECNKNGIDSFFPILRNISILEEAINKENAKKNIKDTVEQVFRLVKNLPSYCL